MLMREAILLSKELGGEGSLYYLGVFLHYFSFVLCIFSFTPYLYTLLD